MENGEGKRWRENMISNNSLITYSLLYIGYFWHFYELLIFNFSLKNGDFLTF